MGYISGDGLRVRPAQSASRLASDQDKRDRRGRKSGRIFAQGDPDAVQPGGSASGGANSAAGLAWWYMDARCTGQGAPDDDFRQNRLRTAQMMRAVRDLAEIGEQGNVRTDPGVSGEILEADALGGDDARIIGGEAEG